MPFVLGVDSFKGECNGFEVVLLEEWTQFHVANISYSEGIPVYRSSIIERLPNFIDLVSQYSWISVH